LIKNKFKLKTTGQWFQFDFKSFEYYEFKLNFFNCKLCVCNQQNFNLKVYDEKLLNR